MPASSIYIAIGYPWVVLGGATQGDPEDGSFSLLGRLHLTSSFFQILRFGRMAVVEPRMFPTWNFYLFEYRPCLYRLLALGSGMPVFLAILAWEDPRRPLALPRGWAAGGVVICISAVEAVSGWPAWVSCAIRGPMGVLPKNAGPVPFRTWTRLGKPE